MRPFGFQNLRVYQHSVAFAADAFREVSRWNPRHAVCDHLHRASEGVVLCLADADAAASDVRFPAIDAALGSTAECAACMDLAEVKALADSGTVKQLKDSLLEIGCMLVGLRKAWNARGVRDGSDVSYSRRPSVEGFRHERLQAYRTALLVARWLSDCDRQSVLPAAAFRGLDTAATSVVLNIAEGNGRFSEAEQRRFLETARRAAVKMAARVDVAKACGLIMPGTADAAHALLAQVARLTHGMIRRRSADATADAEDAVCEVRDPGSYGIAGDGGPACSTSCAGPLRRVDYTIRGRKTKAKTKARTKREETTL